MNYLLCAIMGLLFWNLWLTFRIWALNASLISLSGALLALTYATKAIHKASMAEPDAEKIAEPVLQ